MIVAYFDSCFSLLWIPLACFCLSVFIFVLWQVCTAPGRKGEVRELEEKIRSIENQLRSERLRASTLEEELEEELEEK